MQKPSRKLILPIGLLLVLCVAGAFWFFLHRSTRSAAKNSADLEELQALPYVQWTKDKEGGARRGVKLYDRTRAWPGYNVYTNDENIAYLMDMGGNQLHSWYFRRRKKCEYAHLLPTGEMIGVCMGQGLWKVDWDSNEVWINRMFVHHDIEPLPDGTFWTIRREKNRAYKGRFVVFDALQRVSANGELLEKWYTFDHLDEIQKWHKPTELDVPPAQQSQIKYDYYHVNTVKLLPENPHREDKRFQPGNLLVCFRNVNLIAILDRETLKIVWGYGVDELDWPHMPVMLPNGNILIFDNGLHRKFSRVVEVDPVSKRIVWSYGDQKTGFYSGLQGSAQRLPNGNTLICESEKGHVFEISPQGKLVWEFWNPEMKGEHRKTIYRFLRVPFETIEWKFKPEK